LFSFETPLVCATITYTDDQIYLNSTSARNLSLWRSSSSPYPWSWVSLPYTTYQASNTNPTFTAGSTTYTFSLGFRITATFISDWNAAHLSNQLHSYNVGRYLYPELTVALDRIAVSLYIGGLHYNLYLYGLRSGCYLDTSKSSPMWWDCYASATGLTSTAFKSAEGTNYGWSIISQGNKSYVICQLTNGSWVPTDMMPSSSANFNNYYVNIDNGPNMAPYDWYVRVPGSPSVNTVGLGPCSGDVYNDPRVPACYYGCKKKRDDESDEDESEEEEDSEEYLQQEAAQYIPPPGTGPCVGPPLNPTKFCPNTTLVFCNTGTVSCGGLFGSLVNDPSLGNPPGCLYACTKLTNYLGKPMNITSACEPDPSQSNPICNDPGRVWFSDKLYLASDCAFNGKIRCICPFVASTCSFF